MSVRTPITLYPAQVAVFEDSTRIRVVIGGELVGKTTLGMACMIDQVKFGGRGLWVSPSWTRASRVMFELAELFAANVAEFRKVDRRLTFTSGGQIEFYSAVAIEDFRGSSVDFAVVDDGGQMKSDVWDVVRMVLMRRAGGALILSKRVLDDRHWINKVWKLGNDPNEQDYKSWVMGQA